MASTSSSPKQRWLGTSMEDIYNGHGPWGFEVPSVAASRYHAVLYELPATLKSPPKPHLNAETHHWDDDHVRMPFSPKNLFSVKNGDEKHRPKPKWEVIQESLLQPINSSRELESILSTYNTKLPKLLALHYFFEEVLEPEETQEFFESLLPGIIRLALQLPEILPGNLPLLKQGSCKSISLSQLQIASLLANAFLCTFPWNKDGAYPGVNFVRLFTAHLRPKREQAVAEKLKCICHYFKRVLTAEPVGVVTFERKHIRRSLLPRWDRLETNLGNTRIHVASTGVIEDDGLGLLQVDFANKNVGGGVLGFGCVQEEIRFIICPELIVSRLFTEQLGPAEALVVIGAERYSNYTGYGDDFVWDGNCQDTTPHDSSGRRRTSIVAIDALRFGRPLEQYNTSNILRELNKAYVGFHSNYEGELPAVATGNWGCGAYRGDPILKFLIQLMACSATKRDMVYFTFENDQLLDDIINIYVFLATNQMSITHLWRYLCRFAQASVKSEHLFSFIQQAHFDNKTQLCIRDFFCFNKKKDKGQPSTSNSTRSENQNEDNVDGINSNPLTDDSPTDSLSTKISDVDSDSDIFESSQNETTPLPKDAKETDNAKESLQRKREYSDEDFFKIIDTVDSRTSNKKKDTPSLSLLDTIDELGKKLEPKKEEKMDVEKVEEYDTPKTNDSLSRRNKITDYFTKIDMG